MCLNEHKYNEFGQKTSIQICSTASVKVSYMLHQAVHVKPYRDNTITSSSNWQTPVDTPGLRTCSLAFCFGFVKLSFCEDNIAVSFPFGANLTLFDPIYLLTLIFRIIFGELTKKSLLIRNLFVLMLCWVTLCVVNLKPNINAIDSVSNAFLESCTIINTIRLSVCVFANVYMHFFISATLYIQALDIK